MHQLKPISNIFEPVFININKNFLIPPPDSLNPPTTEVFEAEKSPKEGALADTGDCTPTDSLNTLSPQNEKIIHATEDVSIDDAPMDLPKSEINTIPSNPMMVKKVSDEMGLDELLDSLPKAKRHSRRMKTDPNNK
jgi:hypothetical protein